MVERAGSCLLLVLAFTGLAHGAGRHERWKAVEQLAQGKPIEVEVQGLAGVEGCRLVSVDDSALTCVRKQDPNANWDAASGARLVFPRASVRNVWLMEPEGHERRFWIGMGVGFAIGAVLCAGGGPGTAFACAGIGALIGALIGLDAALQGPSRMPRPVYYPQRRPRPPELHSRLIYQAPAVAPTSP
jgi:hypothetical protein